MNPVAGVTHNSGRSHPKQQPHTQKPGATQ